MKVAAAAGLLVLSASALAQQARPLVGLSLSGSEADRAAFSGSLGELLERLGVKLQLRSAEVAAPEALLASVDANFSNPDEVTVTVADKAGRVVLVRRLTRTGSSAGSSSVVVEAAAHISHAVIEELLVERRRVPAVPTTAPVPVVAAAAATEAVDGPGLEVGGLFVSRAFGGGSPVALGGGLHAAVSLSSGRWRPSVWLLGAYQAPIEMSDEFVQLFTQSLALRVGPWVSALHGRTFRLDVGLGGGADLFFTRAASSVVPPDRLRPARADAAPVLTGLLALHLAVARSADLVLAFTLDVDLAPRRFVLDVGGQHDELFAPMRVRPALMLGFSFSALGPEPYAGRIGAVP